MSFYFVVAAYFLQLVLTVSCFAAHVHFQELGARIQIAAELGIGL
jgi:hypothetical protein